MSRTTLEPTPMTYMGTKKHIAPEVAQIIRGHRPRSVVDPFAGMAAVATALEGEPNVLLSDALHFVAHVARVRFATGNALRPADLAAMRGHVERHKRRLAGYEGHRTGSAPSTCIATTRRVSNDAQLRRKATTLRRRRDGSRYQLATLYYADTYFSLEQCIEIDALRCAIDRHDSLNRDVLLACLLIACSRCINSPGHSAQYLRGSTARSEARVRAKWSRSIWDSFVNAVETFRPVGSSTWRAGNSVLQGEATAVLASLPARSHGVVYMDPPYTKDHYSRFYHVYEELFLYRFPSVHGVGIYPEERFASRFSIKSQALEAYRELFLASARVAPAMVLSFPEDTFLGPTEETLLPLLEETHRAVSVTRVRHLHSSLGGSPGFASLPVVELLIDCEVC